MFRSTDAATAAPTHGDVDPTEPFVPLSQLALGLAAPVEGWAAYLTGRNIEIVEDDVGREAISRSAAKGLIAEECEREAFRREKAAAAEKLAVEADERRRASIWRGLPSEYLPVGVAPAAAMLQSARDSRPKRTTPLQEALAGESLTYHPLAQTDEE
jgi:hypothetical protein